MKKLMGNILKAIGTFVKKSSEDSLTAYAAQATFFVMLSFFPFMMLLLVISSRLSLANPNMVLYVIEVVPKPLTEYIVYVINDIKYSNASSFTIVTLLVSFWSAGKGMQTFTNALNRIYRVQPRKNFVLTRALCSIYTFVFLLLCVVVIILHVFGGPIARQVVDYFPEFVDETMLLLSLKNVFTFLVLCIFVLLLYYQLPRRKGEMRHEIVGAACASLLWMIVTEIFTKYMSYVAGKSTMYGSMTSLILILIWLYVSMQIVLYGAEINFFMTNIINKYVRRRKAKRRLKRDNKFFRRRERKEARQKAKAQKEEM